MRAAAIPLMFSLGLALATPAQAAYTFEGQTCAKPAAGVECGHVVVPENYEHPAGRKISLNVMVLRAVAAPDTSDAQFEFEGGPGFAATELAAFYLTDGASYRARRDIVLVDLRGTGGSQPLRCKDIEALPATVSLYPPELVSACAVRLAGSSDLSQYTTENGARDLDAVRQALGYRTIVINAISYGTTLALAYITQHPDVVRAAILTGAVPADRTPPRYHSTAATQALQHLFALCAATPACHAAYPDPQSTLAKLRAGMSPDVDELFMERLRTQLYLAPAARTIPRDIARGAFAPPAGKRDFADGLYLSITCAESFGHFDVNAARVEARATPFGDYRLRRQQAACAVWPVTTKTPPSPQKPLQTAVLFVSGDLDPVAPPQWAAEVLRFFPNGRQIVLAGAGHAIDGMSALDTCFDLLAVRFFDTADAAALDLTCVADIRAPEFVTE